jgi:hypothetical protein
MRPSPALVLGIAFLVAACGGVTARTGADYVRGEAPEAKFKKDAEACDKQAAAHQKEFGNGPYDLTRGPYNRMYDMCMQSAGYPLKPTP